MMKRGSKFWPLTCKVMALGSAGFCVTPCSVGGEGDAGNTVAQWDSLRRREKITLLL